MTKFGLARAHRPGWIRYEPIDPGIEPPLSVNGETVGPIEHHRVSPQWLTGVILTAISGAALMAAAVFASLRGSANIASHPEEIVLRGLLGIGASRREDRLPLPAASTFSRKVIKLSTVNRVKNHEVVRVRPFVRLAGDLQLGRSALLDHIPPFNPQRLLAESAPGGNALPQAEPNAEVTFVMRNLSTLLPKLTIKLVTPPDEVTRRVREAAVWIRKASNYPSAHITGIKLAYADSAEHPGFAMHIAPENVTRLPKTTDKTTGGVPFKRRTVTVKKGESVASILSRLGATDAEIATIDKLLGSYGGKDGIKAGDRLHVLLSPASNSQRLQPVRVIVSDDGEAEAVVALSNSGDYVSVDPKIVDDAAAERTDEQADTRQSTGDITLYQSFYETALRNHVPRAIIDDFFRIYAFNVDFERRVRLGDSFALLYAKDKRGSATDKRNEIVFASLKVGGRTKDLYRFRSPATGTIDYYNRHGESAKTFLLRKPVPVGVLTSGFGWRKHPILGVVLMHTGIDWAAPMGTPVYAAGDGVIEREGWEPGYGKFMLLRHAYGYETAYAHLSGYARGTHVGEHVRQGQVIAFVGSTGLSTGPHLNFEFRVNGHFVDPLRIKLPHEHTLHGVALAQFQQERKRLDMIMTPASLHVASRT